MRVNAALTTAVFQHALRLSSVPRGRANNVLMSDPTTCGRVLRFLYRPVVLPLTISVTFIALLRFLGAWPAIATLVLFGVISPINYYGIRKLDSLSRK